MKKLSHTIINCLILFICSLCLNVSAQSNQEILNKTFPCYKFVDHDGSDLRLDSANVVLFLDRAEVTLYGVHDMLVQPYKFNHKWSDKHKTFYCDNTPELMTECLVIDYTTIEPIYYIAPIIGAGILFVDCNKNPRNDDK